VRPQADGGGEELLWTDMLLVISRQREGDSASYETELSTGQASVSRVLNARRGRNPRWPRPLSRVAMMVQAASTLAYTAARRFPEFGAAESRRPPECQPLCSGSAGNSGGTAITNHQKYS
jgi:hypothetical protein